jgi:P-type Cu+ transporter
LACPTESASCFHCGTPTRGAAFSRGDKDFCCNGCLTVFELLTENGLTDFYSLSENAGVRVKAGTCEEQFRYLDASGVRERLIDFENEKLTRVTFSIPAIHCVACVWLLENLFRLKNGIGSTQVNFLRKTAAITFENAQVKLSEVVALLASLGYEPELKFSDLEQPKKNPAARRLWLQLGYAGFAFGNLMLFSIATYFGLDAFSGPTFKKLVGYISLVLAIPVVTYSALDYWRVAWTTVKQKRLAIEVPIAAGILAIFGQSAFEVLGGRGEGYFDSLCGLIFFLLCGRLFQQKTYDRLSFERDYKSFFPLSVTRRSRREEAHSEQIDQSLLTSTPTEEQVALAQLRIGDRLIIRNGELIPADAKLILGTALIDYSFVTGESEPVAKRGGDYLYAGGRQSGGAIEVEMVKAVSQSYLTSLWNQEAFRKDKAATFATLINKFSYRFTKIVVAIALGSALFWIFKGDTARAFKAFTSVLIVACPCALALAAPFTLGTAIRLLGRRNVFVKSPEVIESLAQVDSIVFDKTGTLTAVGAGSISFDGTRLSADEQRWIYSLAQQSTHPLSVRVADSLAAEFTEPVRSFVETSGCGVEGIVAGREVLLGSAPWLRSRRVAVSKNAAGEGSFVHVAIDGAYRGAFVLTSALRPDTDRLLENLSRDYRLALLSGDNEKERDRFTSLFGDKAHLQFNQSPLNKFEFIRTLQRSGKTVMMVGDGLNDAGALKQSDVGVAVVENISAFSPASDVIMSAQMVPQLHATMRFSKNAVRIVRAGFILSSLYNAIGLSIAAAGLLAPIVCAILMPLSSISVVAFSCGLATWAARRAFQQAGPQPAGDDAVRTPRPTELQEAA